VSRQEQEQQRSQLAQEERARERSMQLRGPSLDTEGGEGGGVDEPADLQAGGGASARPKTEQNEAQSRGVNAALNFMKNYQAERTKALQQAKATQGNAEGNGSEADDGPTKPATRSGEKIGRNDPCFCGSGKKYKHCHGK
jgi:hypothetical protein